MAQQRVTGFSTDVRCSHHTIDAGNTGGCNDQFGVTLPTDQRGAPRKANGAGATRCDIGAFELQRTLDLPLVRK